MLSGNHIGEAVLAWLMFVPLISIAFTIIGLDDVFKEQLKRSYRMPDVFWYNVNPKASHYLFCVL
jgi:hypothetical protein